MVEFFWKISKIFDRLEFDTLNNSMVPSVDVDINVNDEVDVDIVGVDTHYTCQPAEGIL